MNKKITLNLILIAGSSFYIFVALMLIKRSYIADQQDNNLVHFSLYDTLASNTLIVGSVLILSIVLLISLRNLIICINKQSVKD